MVSSQSAPVFRFLKGAAAGSLLGLTVMVAASTARNEGEIKIYVEQNLEKHIQQQEEFLGVTYPKERPRIAYSLPPDKGFGAPGLYDYNTNRIYLRSSQLDPPEWDLLAAKETLDHELMHYYMDKQSEKLVNRSYPDYHNDMTISEILAIRIISEGTATYMERKMSGMEYTPFTDKDWPKTIQGFFFHPLMPVPRTEPLYEGGYLLVKPIIDKHGQKGIEYLMFNPPKEKEILDLPSYRQRILEELSQ